MTTITHHISLAFTILFVVSVVSYPICQQIDVEGYLFQLGKLPDSSFFTVNGTQNGLANVSFCNPAQYCTVDSKTFVKFPTTTASCNIYTYSANPLKQSFTLIDRTAPKKGLKIEFLPSYDATSNISRKTTLSILCSQTYSASPYCSISVDQKGNQNLVCSYASQAGCATLKLNYFWQFLSNNSIVFAILLWVMALFQLFFGYLAIRMTIFIFGILSGSIFGIIYTAERYVDFIYENEGYGMAVFVICLSVLMGILFGISLLTLPRVGYINIGLWVAVIFSLLLQNSVYYLTGSLLAFYITFGVVGLLMTGIALMKLKNYIILSTSFISAFWLVRPLGFFLSSYPNQFLSGQSYLLDSSPDWKFYLYLISIIVLTILGSVFQFCCFKKSASGNQAYYLEQQGTLKQKFKKLLQFEEIKNFVRSGADEFRFFKKLVVDTQDEEDNQNKNNNKRVKQIDIRKASDRSQEQYKQESQDYSAARKKTKLQKQLDDYQSKKVKKQNEKKSKVLYLQQKNIKKQEQPKRKRKVVQVQQIQMSSQDEQQQKKRKQKKQIAQQQQESQDIKPNKLTANNIKKSKK